MLTGLALFCTLRAATKKSFSHRHYAFGTENSRSHAQETVADMLGSQLIPPEAGSSKVRKTHRFYPLTLPITVGPGRIATAITLGAHLRHEAGPGPVHGILRRFIAASVCSFFVPWSWCATGTLTIQCTRLRFVTIPCWVRLDTPGRALCYSERRAGRQFTSGQV